jgi:hypothetical protein
VVFVDDFRGADLDRSHWNVIVTGQTVNDEQQAYVDSPEVLSVTNGTLVIRPRFRQGFKTPEGRGFDFISGRIDTRSKVTFTYGTAAARMKLAAGAGLWPAFWALGDGRWPDTGEIDIMENVGDPAWTSVALHGPGYFGDTPLVRRVPAAGRRDASAWHVYAVDWTRDALGGRARGVSRHTRDGRALRPMGVRQSQAPDPEPGARRKLSREGQRRGRSLSWTVRRRRAIDPQRRGADPGRLGARYRTLTVDS